MAALTIRRRAGASGAGPARRATAAGFRFGLPLRGAVLALSALYFLVPLLASGRFALEGARGTWTLSAVRALAHDGALWSSLLLSVEIALGAAAITLALLSPTSVWVNLRLPRLRRLLEGLTLVPLVVPVVVVVLGLYGAFPPAFVTSPALLALEYVVLAMPYSYRVIDGAVQSLDLHTLTDAGRTLGGGWVQTFFRVLLPQLRTSLMSAAFITIAYCLGEFAMASLLGFTTFPVQLFQIGTEQIDEATAVSVFALLLVFLLLATLSQLGGKRRVARGSIVAGGDGTAAEPPRPARAGRS